MPKWPRSSGPVRKELGCWTDIDSTFRNLLVQKPTGLETYWQLGIGLAGGADEGANLLDVLLARRMLDTAGYVEAIRPGDSERLRHIAGIEPARKHERYRPSEIFQKPPIERLPVPARPAGGARRPRIEHQHIGDLGVELDRGQIGALADRQRLDHRKPEAGADPRNALRRLPAVQLQQVGLEGGDAFFQELVGGVGRDRDLAGAARQPLAQA